MTIHRQGRRPIRGGSLLTCVIGAVALMAVSSLAGGQERRFHFHPPIDYAPQPPSTYLGRGENLGPVYAVSFSPDSRLVAAAGGSEDVRLWDVDTGETTVILQHPDAALAVAFSSDGLLLATASRSSVYLWTVEGEQLARLDGHRRAVTDVTFTPNSSRIVSSSQDGTARIWDAMSYQELGVLQHDGAVHAVAVHPNGRTLATGSSDGSATIWSMATLTRVRSLGHPGPVYDVAFDEDGARLAAANLDGARLWNTGTWQLEKTLWEAEPLKAVTFFGADALIALSAGAERVARLWATTQKRESVLLESHGLHSIAAAQNNMWAAAGSGDGSTLLWLTWDHIDDLRSPTGPPKGGGMIMALVFDEGSGNVARDVLGGNDGVFHGDVTWVPGRVGNAAFIADSASDNMVVVANSEALNPDGAITLSMWAIVESLPDGNGALISKDGAWMIHTSDWRGEDGMIDWEPILWTPDFVAWQTTASVPVPLGEWHHIAVVYDGDAVTTYIDGMASGWFAQSGPIARSQADIVIGRDGRACCSDRRASLAIDEVSIWWRALSANEVVDRLINGAVDVQARGKLPTSWGLVKSAFGGLPSPR